MKRFQDHYRQVVPTLLLLAAVSCATSSDHHASSSTALVDDDAFAAPTDLAVTLATPVDIDLRWKNHATWPGCYFVEFTFAQRPGNDDFTMLDALWPGTTRFRHDKVAPETHFVYRIRPLFGQPSAVVDAAPALLPFPNAAVPRVKGDPSPTPSREMEGPLDLLPEKNSAPKYSIRDTRTAMPGAPVHLAATPAFANAIDLRWQDRASDEDGYLVDVSVNPTNDFRVCALLPADTTSFRKTGLPAGIKYYFRVRAFFYGKPSNLAEMVSGQEPADNDIHPTGGLNSARPVIAVERE